MTGRKEKLIVREYKRIITAAVHAAPVCLITGEQAIHRASRVRLRQDPPVIVDRVWRFGTSAGISRPNEAPFVRKGRREVVTRAYGSSSHALHAEGGPFVMPLTDERPACNIKWQIGRASCRERV